MELTLKASASANKCSIVGAVRMLFMVRTAARDVEIGHVGKRNEERDKDLIVLMCVLVLSPTHTSSKPSNETNLGSSECVSCESFSAGEWGGNGKRS